MKSKETISLTNLNHVTSRTQSPRSVWDVNCNTKSLTKGSYANLCLLSQDVIGVGFWTNVCLVKMASLCIPMHNLLKTFASVTLAMMKQLVTSVQMDAQNVTMLPWHVTLVKREWFQICATLWHASILLLKCLQSGLDRECVDASNTILHSLAPNAQKDLYSNPQDNANLSHARTAMHLPIFLTCVAVQTVLLDVLHVIITQDNA